MRFRIFAFIAILVISQLLLGCNMARKTSIKCKNYNIILILIDVLRADHLPCYGYQKNTAPYINELAGKSIVFDNAISQSSWTKPSMASLFTSLFPHNHNTRRRKDMLPENAHCIAKDLNTSGYYTFAIQPNPCIKSRHAFNQGFDEYLEGEIRKYQADTIVDIFNRFLDMRKKSDKFFAYLHFMDVHYRYNPPQKYRHQFVDEDFDGLLNSAKLKIMDFKDKSLNLSVLDKKHLEALYDAEINFVDDQIRRILEKLTPLKMMDNTIIIITSDHGEEFWDHGAFEHGHMMYNELLWVPLIIYQPRLKVRNKRIKQLIRLIVIYPTLMNFLNLKTKAEFMGQDLSEIINADKEHDLGLLGFREEIFHGSEQTALQSAHFKIIKHKNSNLYDFYNLNQDKEEHFDLVRDKSVRVELRKFKALLKKYENTESKTCVSKAKDENRDYASVGGKYIAYLGTVGKTVQTSLML